MGTQDVWRAVEGDGTGKVVPGFWGHAKELLYWQ